MNAKKLIAIIMLAACITGVGACAPEGNARGGLAFDTMESWQGGFVVESEYAETYQVEDCSLTNPPTAIHEITSRSSLDALSKGSWKPANVIVHFSRNYNVLDENGGKLDSFSNVYTSLLSKKMIPILYLKDMECANAAIAFMTERMQIFDIAVMSEDPQAVKTVRERFPYVRGILSYGSLTTVKGIANAANEAFASTVVIPQNAASIENVRYIQARFKTVWVKSLGNTSIDFWNCIGSGAYGVISSDFGAYYNALCDYSKGAIRTPYNVAHRGLPTTHHENSVSGTIAASQAGATHVELDGWLSKDKHIVMMHNRGMGATCSGGGDIPDMTLEEIRRYKLNRKDPVEEVPILPDIIDALKGTETILVFEIKDGRNEIVDELKKIIEEKEFEEQIVVISFAQNIMTEEFEQYYKDRGMMGWYWTFDTAGQVTAAANAGFIGLTNNAAAKFSSSAAGKSLAMVKPLKSYDARATLEVGEKIDLVYVSYCGESIVREGTVRLVEDLGDKFAVVANCETGENKAYAPHLYTQVFYIDKI